MAKGRFKSTVWKVWDVLYPIVFFELCLVVSTLVIMIICGMYYGGISMDFVLRQFPAAAILINILFYGVSVFVLGRAYKRDNLRFGEFHDI